ncbi:MAG: hypothetical protein ACU0C9_10455 [Paracoccaceae bacterium]
MTPEQIQTHFTGPNSYLFAHGRRVGGYSRRRSGAVADGAGDPVLGANGIFKPISIGNGKWRSGAARRYRGAGPGPYDPVLRWAASDASHALRLFARLEGTK